MKKRIVTLLISLFNVILLCAQRRFDYDDSDVPGSAVRVFNALLIIVLLIIGAIALIFLGYLFTKIYLWLNPDSKPEYISHKVQVKEEKQKIEEKRNAIEEIYKEIDLGLSVKWSNVNFGARFDWELIGFNYSWGELHTNNSYSYDLLNTNLSVIGDISGNPQYDIVCKTLGNGWRIPTKDELMELAKKCKWTKDSFGYKVTGPNGNSIVLPTGGFVPLNGNPFASEHDDEGYYWSSTPEFPCSLMQYVYCLSFGGRYLEPTVLKRQASDGIMIRPVRN